MEHHLAVKPGHTPVKHRQRKLSIKRLKVIEIEVEKLVKAGIIRHVWYSEWLANPMLVLKANGKWRI